ncbi:MAG: OPT/YSL family transporter, partial [Myxococcales bacterium]|nr:OPT/YSL family transporter [Myxococcales bacterium]
AMTVAVAYSLKRFVGARSEDGRAAAADPLVDVDSGQRRLQYLAIVLGMFVLSGWLIARDGATRFSFAMTAAVLVCASLMVVLGAILSLQIGSSASPVSGTIFVTTLVLCLVALAVGRTDISDVRLLTPLLVGACVAVCTANDSSQDYKTMQLCGVAVQDGFLAQLLGLLGGCLVVPIVLYIAHDAYALGSEELVAPQGQMFATLVDGLLLQSALPWRPIFVGLSLGVMAVIMESASGRVGLQLPSMALAVGIYLPAYLGVGILIGSLARFVGERRGAQRNESILAAAGLITGAALLDLILGVLIVFFGFQESSLVVTRPSAAIQNTAGLLGIALLGGLLYANSRRRAP